MKSGLRVFLWLTGGTAGLLVLMLLATLTIVFFSQEKLAKAKAELVARGETFDVMQLAPPPTPEEDSGAGATLEALRELKVLVKKNKPSRIYSGQKEVAPGKAEAIHRKAEATIPGGTKKTWGELADEYTALQPPLTALRKALTHPVQAVNLDYSKGVNTQVEHVTDALLGAQYLASDAQIKLQRGDTSGAVEDLEALLRLTHLCNQPLLICSLVQFSIEGIAQAGTWDCLQASGLEPESLARLQKAWEEIPDRDVRTTLRFERAGALPVFSSAGFEVYRASKDVSLLFGPATTTPTWPEKLEEAQDRAYFETWRIIFRHEDEREFIANYQTLIDQTGKTDFAWADVIQSSNEIRGSLVDSGIGRLFSKMTFTSIDGVIERFGLSEAQRNLAIAAIAIRRYQLDHAGALPPTLDALVPQYLAAVPRDPLDGRTLRYQPKGEEFLLYSVGLDGVDEGGDPGAPLGKKKLWFMQYKDGVWPQVAPTPTQP